MKRRRGEPEPTTLLRFIADHESLRVCAEEFTSIDETRLREILREIADGLQPVAPKRTAPKKAATPDSQKMVVYTDGASRGNPGLAGAGWIIEDEQGSVLGEGARFLGKKTNNEAEYEAVILALQHAQQLGALSVSLRSDSELLVRQINGRYQVRSDRLRDLNQAARVLLQGFRKFDIKHVRRELNTKADALANKALDERR